MRTGVVLYDAAALFFGKVGIRPCVVRIPNDNFRVVLEAVKGACGGKALCEDACCRLNPVQMGPNYGASGSCSGVWFGYGGSTTRLLQLSAS